VHSAQVDATQSNNVAAGVTDFVDVSDATNEARHGYRGRGRVAREVAGDFIGGHDMRRMVRSVSGTGSSVSYRLKVQPHLPVTLEFEEVENRTQAKARSALVSGAVRGYSVWVDGQRAYFRTAHSSGAGPLHFFVQVPARTKTLPRSQATERDGHAFSYSAPVGDL
jgi:hypothetical protein